ncbi:MAG: Two-component transcriptional response regulator, LuxR family [uncultured Adhaeribacter sp.]|uniref:Two-component transcriptional response regulator, LuxR family n=1 Tax=uncultured Adhaeribacter sp. TaxID=448109 RepID=A0A6J4IHT5_9BACT|nr:MAG: Two-component transcriptional response regulator, LuxR family [uncultured Adhaeribacter sp.]
MINALIIDDEPLARSLVVEYLQAYSEIHVVQQCSDGFEGVKAVQQHHPDLIFLDIQMPKINGFEMLELLEDAPAVIFTTAFDQYALKAFEAHAVDYLLKPFSQERFDKAVQKWLHQRHSAPTERKSKTEALLETAAQTPERQDRIVVKLGHKIHIIPTPDILFLTADDDYVNVHTAQGTFLKNRTLQFFEQTLDPQHFVRVHRSYMVQVAQITRLDPYQKDNYVAKLRNGTEIPVSRTGYAKLRTVLQL